MPYKERTMQELTTASELLAIKALTALVDPLSLSVAWKNGPEQGLKTVSFNP